MVNVVPRKVLRPKTLRDFNPFGFGLGTSLGTPITKIPPLAFQNNVPFFLSFIPNICWFVLFTMFLSINYMLVTMLTMEKNCMGRGHIHISIDRHCDSIKEPS